MELELQQQELASFEVVFHTALAREETMEMIVPDAYPDILAVLDTSGIVLMGRKEVSAGCVSVAGTVRCNILYRPEAGSPVQAMEAELPFQTTVDDEHIPPSAHCVATVRLALVETRVLNPRKVLLRAETVTEVTVYSRQPFTYCGDIPEHEAKGVEQRVTEYQGCFVREVTERPFHFSDTLNLPGSNPPIQTVLRSAVRVFSTEEKLIGGKLIFKGSASVSLLYISVDGAVSLAGFDLPFSQMVEAGGSPEALYQLELSLLGCEVSPPDSDGRQLMLELDILAQATIRETQILSMVTDAYSIHCATVPEFSQCSIPKLLGQVPRRYSLRELLEAPAQAREVLSAQLHMGLLRTTRKDHALELSAELRCFVVYEDAQGELGTVSQTFPMTMEVEAPHNCIPYVSFNRDDTTAMVTAGGLELRSDLEFQLLIMGQESICGLTAFQMDTEKELDFEGKPSIVLRQFRKGETLWDIAKAYCTTCGEIERANELEECGAVVGQMLLIPRKR